MHMARDNLNKSEDLVTNTTAASNYIPRRPTSIEIPPLDPNLINKSTFKCEHCETRFTS